MPGPAIRRGFTRLAFALQAPWWHLGEAAGPTDVASEVTIVLAHAGLPGDRSEEDSWAGAPPIALAKTHGSACRSAPGGPGTNAT